MIYVHEELANQFVSENLPLRLYSSFDDEKAKDIYTDFLFKTETYKEIELDNLKFIEEVENYKVRSKLNIIFDDYNNEFQYINEMERKIKENQEKSEFKKISLSPTLNFCLFLRFHKGNKDKKFEPYINWTIANSCFMNQCPEMKSLENFSELPQIWQDKIKEQLNKISSANKFKSIDLKVNKNEYNILINEYEELCYNISVSSYFLQKAENNVSEALHAAIHLNNFLGHKNSNNFFGKFLSEFFKIISLFLCSKIQENLKNQELAEVYLFIIPINIFNLYSFKRFFNILILFLQI